ELQQAGPNGPPRQAQLRQSVIESILQPGGWMLDPMSARIGAAGEGVSFKRLLLIGWMDQAPPEVTIARRDPAQKTTAVIYTALPYRLPSEGRLSIGPGLLNGR